MFVLFLDLFQKIAPLRAIQAMHYVRVSAWAQFLLGTPEFGLKGLKRLQMSVLFSGSLLTIFIIGPFFDSPQMNWLVTKRIQRKDSMSVFFSSPSPKLLPFHERLKIDKGKAHVVSLLRLEFLSIRLI